VSTLFGLVAANPLTALAAAVVALISHFRLWDDLIGEVKFVLEGLLGIIETVIGGLEDIITKATEAAAKTAGLSDDEADDFVENIKTGLAFAIGGPLAPVPGSGDGDDAGGGGGESRGDTATTDEYGGATVDMSNSEFYGRADEDRIKSIVEEGIREAERSERMRGGHGG
jgi:hypothetical protein